MVADRAIAERLLLCLREAEKRDAQRKLEHCFPDETHEWRGQTYHARRYYPMHTQWFAASAEYGQCGFIAANRVGKSFAGAYQTALHLTGRYPDWWEGRRFSGPIRAWAAGKSNETTRDIVMHELLGPAAGSKAAKTVAGTGMIPGDTIGAITWRAGVADLVDTVKVRHVSGGWSTLGLKSYEQGRGAFEGTSRHLIWCDEEPPADVYDEARVRTMDVEGLTLLTFTPLEGMSEVVLRYLADDTTAVGLEG